MQREIKFRVWDKKFHKWIHTLNVSYDGQLYVNAPYETTFVIQQFTGVKDKNGKEIYEGDIVEIQDGLNPLTSNSPKNALYEILWEKRCFVFKPINVIHMVGAGYMNNKEDQVFVIGNIFENPELLKQ